MSKLKLPFELERISQNSPAVRTDAIDDSLFNKTQEEVNQQLNDTITSLSAQTSIYDESGVPLSANPVSITENPEFATALIDSEGKLLYGIRRDGSVYQCSTDDLTQEQIDKLKNDLTATIANLSGNTTEEIEALYEYIDLLEADLVQEIDTTNANLLELSGQTTIFDENGVPVSGNPVSFASNPEFAIATIDSDGKLLYGIRKDGSVYQCATDDITQEQIDNLRKSAESALLAFSAETAGAFEELTGVVHGLSGQTCIFDEEGTPLSGNPVSMVSNPEFVTAMVDAEGKLLYGIRKDGSVYQCATDDITQSKIDSFSADTASKLQALSEKIDRNWVGVEYDESEGTITALLGEDSKIKNVNVDEDGNITFEQQIN